MRARAIAKRGLQLIGLAIFITILSRIDLYSVASALFGIPLLLVALLGLMVVPIIYLNGVRWHQIVTSMGLHLSPVESSKALCISQMVNLTLPGNVGDLIRVPYLKARGNPSDKAVLSLLIDAIIASIIPYTFGLLVLAFVLQFSISIEAMIIIVTWILGFYLMYKLLKKFLWPWFLEARLSRLRKGGVTQHIVFAIPSILRQMKRGNIGLAILASMLSWSVFTLQAFFLAKSLGFEIDFLYLSSSLGAVAIFTSIPISINGLGVRDGVLLFLFGLQGINPELIISFSICLMLLNLTPAFAGIYLWMQDPFTEISIQVLENPEDALKVTEPLKICDKSIDVQCIDNPDFLDDE